MNANWTWKAQGEANEYAVLDGGKWVAAIRLNGEMTVARQEQVMSGIVSVHDLVAVAQYVVDRAGWQCWDEKDALFVMARAAIAKVAGAEAAATAATVAGPSALSERIRELEAERDMWVRGYKLMEHKVITCGVAAGHSDPNLSRTGIYAGEWNSQQANHVRALRDDRDRLRADIEAACTLLEAKEYAEHWATTELGKRLEAALTELHDDAAIQRDALRAVAEAVAEETTSWVANQHTLGVPNDAPDLDAIIDRVMAVRGAA